jgi:hypothetical protein
MSRYGTVLDATNLKTVYLESSDPLDLETKVNLAIQTIGAMDTPQLIADVTLAGAGDGFSFIVCIEYAPLTAMDGGLLAVGTFVFMYLAATAQELAVKRAALFPAPLTDSVVDSQLAGSSQGTRFMGMVVTGLQSGIDANNAQGLMGFDSETDTLSIANTGVLVPLLSAGMVLQTGADRFDRPAAGVLRYIGSGTILAHVHAVVSCCMPAAVAALHAMRMGIVKAPAGTPVLTSLMTRFGVPFSASAAADAVSAATHSYALLSKNDTIGIALQDDTGALTGSNALNVVSAQLLAIEIG